MATIGPKLYLHDALTTDGGTLPGATNQSGLTVDTTASGASTNRTLDGTIGVAQASSSVATIANLVSQLQWNRRFCSPPLATQTTPAGSATGAYHIGGSISSNIGSYVWAVKAYYWRPSTGAIVGFPVTGSGSVDATSPSQTTTGQKALTFTSNVFAVNILDGDILVVELFTNGATSMSTSITVSTFYDGTTEDSTTSEASYVNYGAALTLQPPPLPFGEGHELRGDPKSLQVLGQAVKRSAYYCLGEKWAKRGKLWVPAADRPYAVAV